MKAYPEYKSVSAEEKIIYPSHWQCVKPKFFVSLDKGRKPNDTSFDNTGLPPYLTMDVLRGRDTLVQYPFSSENLLEVHDNDTLILWDGANAGEVMVGKHGFLSSTMALVNFDSTKFNKFFILYLLKSKEPIFKLKASGTTIPHFDGKYFLDTPIAFPNYDEQTAIAEYLDEVTGKIDALVDEKQAQVDELRAYRTSLITETVTRGLNSNAPLKDTGIDWLGDIPQHWENIKLKFLLDEPMMYGANESPESDINIDNPRYIRITDIDENGNLKDETYRTLQYDKAHPYLLKYGDVLFARSGATVGKTYRFTECYPACFAGYLIKASCGRKLLSSFLIYYTNSQSYNNWKNSIFDQSTIQNIAADKYNNLSVPLPPLSEQQEIAEFLDKKTTKIDALIAELEAQLKDLIDYKQAVITEAVTGKVDVRDYKPSN